MTEALDLLIRGGTAVTPAGAHTCDIGVRMGKIVALGDLSQAPAAETLNARGLHILPGVIDSQVHFREPGNEHKEDLATGTASAALGGVCTVFEMPNTNPTTTTVEAIEDKLRRASGRAWTDHAFFAGATPGNVDSLEDLELLPGVCGIKVFMGKSTGDLLVDEDEALEGVLRSGFRRVAIHAEDQTRLDARKHLAIEAAHARAHPVWRDPQTGLRATQRLLAAARKTARRVHVLHITTAEELRLLAHNKDLATVELLPQHLSLTAPECYEQLGSRAQMNPPIREKYHQDALWAAVANGVVDVLGSDHAPHTLEEKARTYPGSPSGMPGVQTMLPLMLDHVAAGRLTLHRLVDLLCHGPARIYGLANKGRLAVGYDADLTLVDLNRTETLLDQDMASRCGWTPFHGRTVQGWPVGTVIRGHRVMADGELLGQPVGRACRFHETFRPGAR